MVSFLAVSLRLVNRSLRRSADHEASAPEEETIRSFVALGHGVEFIAAHIRLARAGIAYLEA